VWCTAATFDDTFRFRLLYSLATNALYCGLALAACVPLEEVDRKGRIVLVEPSCPCAAPLYMALPLLAVVIGLLPLLRAAPAKAADDPKTPTVARVVDTASMLAAKKQA